MNAVNRPLIANPFRRARDDVTLIVAISPPAFRASAGLHKSSAAPELAGLVSAAARNSGNMALSTSVRGRNGRVAFALQL
jgi:hypothetical protein